MLFRALKQKGWHGALLCEQDLVGEDFDSKENGDPQQDLTRDDVLTRLLAFIKAKEFDFIIMGPPCETFSHAREKKPGSRPLHSFSKLYGLARSGLHSWEYEQLRIGNLWPSEMLKPVALSTTSEVVPHLDPLE